MSNTLQQIADFKASKLIDLLKQCTDAQQLMFKRMYAGGNLNLTIEDVVKNLPTEKYDWAVKQVERTLLNKKP